MGVDGAGCGGPSSKEAKIAIQAKIDELKGQNSGATVSKQSRPTYLFWISYDSSRPEFSKLGNRKFSNSNTKKTEIKDILNFVFEKK